VVIQVEVFWILTPCSVSEVHAASIFTLQQHYMASQLRRPQLESRTSL